MKKFITLILTLALLCTMTSAFAITGNDCGEPVEFEETGIATFILDDSSRIVGALYHDEKLGKLDYQHGKRTSPTYINDGRTLRRRKWARVNLDENNYVTRGGTQLEVTVIITRMDLVERVIEDEISVASVIDHTIYAPCLNPPCGKVYAAHMFMPADSGRIKVGVVKFANEKCLDLFVGYFDDDDQLDLGFTATKTTTKAPAQCVPCTPCVPCYPVAPCYNPCYTPRYSPCSSVNTTTSVVVNTTTSTSVSSAFGWCGW